MNGLPNGTLCLTEHHGYRDQRRQLTRSRFCFMILSTDENDLAAKSLAQLYPQFTDSWIDIKQRIPTDNDHEIFFCA